MAFAYDSLCRLRFAAFHFNISNVLLIILTIALYYGETIIAQREFDLFKLSLQWPGTACRTTRHHCCSSNACCDRSESLTEFTIHGLWPDYSDGTWPACCSGKRFDVKEISTLMGNWPSLSCDSPSDCHGGKGLFWEHEWEKHGTCTYPVVQDEYDYFVKAVNLYFKYNVTEMLRESGYVSSNSERYPLGGELFMRFKTHSTQLRNSNAQAMLLRSFDCVSTRIYSNIFVQPRDCDVGSRSSCPRYVTLPENVSSKIENIASESSSEAAAL